MSTHDKGQDPDRSLERVKALGGGIAIQNRMAFQGEYFLDRYGKQAAEAEPFLILPLL